MGSEFKTDDKNKKNRAPRNTKWYQNVLEACALRCGDGVHEKSAPLVTGDVYYYLVLLWWRVKIWKMAFVSIIYMIKM